MSNIFPAQRRTVLRKLVASRVLSVATEPSNLARLTDKACRQEFPVERADNRLARAIARGIPARRKLAEDKGGSFSADRAAQALEISEQAILDKAKRMVELLVGNGANINAKMSSGQTVRAYATAHRHYFLAAFIETLGGR